MSLFQIEAMSGASLCVALETLTRMLGNGGAVAQPTGLMPRVNMALAWETVKMVFAFMTGLKGP